MECEEILTRISECGGFHDNLPEERADEIALLEIYGHWQPLQDDLIVGDVVLVRRRFITDDAGLQLRLDTGTRGEVVKVGDDRDAQIMLASLTDIKDLGRASRWVCKDKFHSLSIRKPLKPQSDA